MAAFSENGDFELGVEGYRFSDLFDAVRLKELAERFYADLEGQDAILHTALTKYVTVRGQNYEKKVESKILTDAAPYLSRFIARLFGITADRADLEKEILVQNPMWRFKFFVQRRAIKKYKAEQIVDLNENELWLALTQLRNTAFDETLVRDEELSVAEMTCGLLDAEEELGKSDADHSQAKLVAGKANLAYDKLKDSEFGKLFSQYILKEEGEGELLTVKAALHLIEAWSAAAFFNKSKRWYSFKTPHPLDYQNLVHLIHPEPALHNIMRGADEELRRRDGFKLTDDRGIPRDSLYEVDYCMICHERDKDACRTGLHEKDGSTHRNPLGIKTEGCPLDERISEMHLLKKQGDPIGSLALVAIDNPMCAGTGHRICNDCMKGCIFQKQEPVNIPLAETATLTDVLDLPYGFEIYRLLTRWNPLNARRPYQVPYNGKNVMIVGLGPAGYTLAHYLLNEGFGVVGIDGLKIEPLPEEWTGADGWGIRPFRDWSEIESPLDERPLAGFGGVSEYGITVRWDKNFLTLLHVTLARRPRFSIVGGVRFGGTVTAEQAFAMGFDHIAIAAGAGRPTIIAMKNNIIRGVRKASDFLMALQLTGAFKEEALANLQAELPAVVIGGGLTAIDTATELLAYYPIQAEKTLARYETLIADQGEPAVRALFDEEERDVLDRLLRHGEEVRRERERAHASGETADLASLCRQWGGVSIVYRRTLEESPAYRLNHEEVIKALEEGISFVEGLEPAEAVPDASGKLAAVRFRRSGSGEILELPARACLVAAGTTPNITYAKEFPNAIPLDERRRFFEPHRAVRGEDGAWKLQPAPPSDEWAFFTGYARDGKFITFFGDNHPAYNGNVVKAMASAKAGYRAIVEVLDGRPSASAPPDAGEAEWESFRTRARERLTAQVVLVRRLTPTIVEVIVRAPAAAENFQPGQFFRLQNLETYAPSIGGSPLLIEPLAL